MKTKDDKKKDAPVVADDATLDALDASDAALVASGGAVATTEPVVRTGGPATPVKVTWPSDKKAVPPVVRRYRVAAKRTIAVNGSIVTLRPGDIVSEESYGPTAMEHIMSGGVQLEEVK